MKAMKAMKAMAAMKAMKAMKKKPISAKLARPCLCWQDQQDQVWVHCCRLQEDQDRQDCEQEGQRPCQGCSWRLDRSSPEGSQGFEHQGFRSYQEGHSTLQEGQGALRPVKAVSNLR